jgi:cell division protein FtsZ
VTGFKRKDPAEEPPGPVSTGQKDVKGQNPSPVQNAGRPAQQYGMTENPVEDLRIPAYIRKNISIHEPFESGTSPVIPASHTPESGVKHPGGIGGAEEQIQKGHPDTPAYLRRKNNASLQ